MSLMSHDPYDDRWRDSVTTYITNIDGRWYAYAGSKERHQVYSIGSDDPKGGGLWAAHWTAEGIQYVATSSPTRKAAYQKARRWGNYCGEVTR